MKLTFDNASIKASKLITNTYSTSFSIGIKCLAKKLHNPIYAIYGYVRLADEIVDSFHGFDQKEMLDQLETETFACIEKKLSLNPILNSFQNVVNQYNIDHTLIHQFLRSMRMDLEEREYTYEDYKLYILGSAEVVGLMCLKVFCHDTPALYDQLQAPAQRLGAAFQKINFLRDLHTDFVQLDRTYFPNVNVTNFDAATKQNIEKEILEDFNAGFVGIKKLPVEARFGTYIAYRYYKELFKRVTQTSAEHILEKRIRVPNRKKYAIFFESALKNSFGLI